MRLLASWNDFWFQNGFNLAPFWGYAGVFFWVFWVSIWHLNLRTFSKRFLVDFWSILDPSGSPKSLKKQWCLTFLLILLDRSWERFWIDFWSILDPRIVSKSLPRSSLKLLKIIAVFGCLLEPQKIDFCVNMAATWPDLGPQNGTKLGPKWCQNRSRRPMGPHGAPMDPHGTPPNRFWIDFGLILGRFWIDLMMMLGGFWVDF